MKISPRSASASALSGLAAWRPPTRIACSASKSLSPWVTSLSPRKPSSLSAAASCRDAAPAMSWGASVAAGGWSCPTVGRRARRAEFLHDVRHDAEAGPHGPATLRPLHGRARGPARVDQALRVRGARAAHRRMGGLGLPGLGVHAPRRVRLPRPRQARAVRRPGGRLPERADPLRGALLRRQRRARHGRRRPGRHGDAADPRVRDRGAEAAVGRPRHRRPEDPLPRHLRAQRGLRRRRHQDARGARRRRLGHQRHQDLHHQRHPRRRDRAGDEDRPRRRLRRLHALPRPDGHARRHAQQAPREARHARVRHGADHLRGRPRARLRGARHDRQGLLPDHVGAPGRAPERLRRQHRRGPAGLRPDAPVRQGRARPSASRSAATRPSATASRRWRSSSRPGASSPTRPRAG